eukprot:1035962-Pleurochrysis_carterae.AAC.1
MRACTRTGGGGDGVSPSESVLAVATADGAPQPCTPRALATTATRQPGGARTRAERPVALASRSLGTRISWA